MDGFSVKYRSLVFRYAEVDRHVACVNGNGKVFNCRRIKLKLSTPSSGKSKTGHTNFANVRDIDHYLSRILPWPHMEISL